MHGLADVLHKPCGLASMVMTTLNQELTEAAEATKEFAEGAEEFAGRIVGAIDAASVAILMSIGHQTKLFDTLAGLPPATSTQIADAAGLNERYVREWLGGVVAGRVVDYDPATQRYSLPQHRAAVLTRAAGPDNLARLAQFIPLLAEVEKKVIGCFHHGGGLSYSEYPRFHTLMAEASGEVFDAALIDTILPMVDGLPERLRAGIEVADFGCGSGHAVNVMARAFPASQFVGIDFSNEGVAAGAAEAKRLGLTNVRFESADVAEFGATESFDLITAFDTIHDQAHPRRVLQNIHRVLRTGGSYLMVDIKSSSRLEDNIGVPMASYLYTVSTMHCMSVSLGLDGEGLGTCWGRELATSMLADAGFSDPQVREIESDPVNYYYVAGK